MTISKIASVASVSFFEHLFFCALVMGLASCAQTAISPAAPTRSAAELEALKRVRFEDTPQGARAILDESILFVTGKAEFASPAQQVLDVLKPVFAKARGQIIVEGHTDSTGTKEGNVRLAMARAEVVRAEVIKRQVPPERVNAKGFASTVPRRAPEVTEEDRRLNRRAEFLFPGQTAASLGAVEAEKQISELDVVKQLLNESMDKAGNFLKSLIGKPEGNKQ